MSEQSHSYSSHLSSQHWIAEQPSRASQAIAAEIEHREHGSELREDVEKDKGTTRRAPLPVKGSSPCY